MAKIPVTVFVCTGKDCSKAWRHVGDCSLRFNLSHSGEMVLYAVARGRELGVDLETIRPDFAVDGIARRFFAAARFAFQSVGNTGCDGGEVLLHLRAAGIEQQVADADDDRIADAFSGQALVAAKRGADTLELAGIVGIGPGNTQIFTDTSAGAWEFPLLAKYRFKGKLMRPFIDAGVSWDKISGATQAVKTPSCSS